MMFTGLTLLSPAALWGLAALAIPVIIHLVNRSRGKRVLVGNIGLIRAARRRRASEIRLEQWLLLLIRILLLVIATLILARLVLPGLTDQPEDVTYVTPAGLASLAPGEGNADAGHPDPQRRLLAAGYPLLGETGPDPVPATGAGDAGAWPLLAERLDAVHHTGRVTVVTGGQVGEFGPRAPALSGEIEWVVPDSSAVGNRPSSQPAFRVIVTHDGTRPAQLRRLEAALAAIQRHRLPGLAWATTADDVGTGTETIPASMATPGDAARLISFSDLPPPSDDPGYPQRLLEYLLTPAEQARAFAHARLDPDVLTAVTAPADEDRAATRPYRLLQGWLALVLVGLWAVERWLSERRRA